MDHEDRQKNAENCINEFQKFLHGLKGWDSSVVDYAEIRGAAIALLYDEEFEGIFREKCMDLREYLTIPEAATREDYAVSVAPSLIEGFFYALEDYMELYKGNMRE